MTYNLSEDQKCKSLENYDKSVFSAWDVFKIMKEILLKEEKIDQDKEHFWIIGLATDKHISFIELVSLGGVNTTIVEPMNVFRVAVLKGAVSIILVHNHPSGNLNPSEADIRITDRLMQAGRIINIEVLDHLIISTQWFFSFLDAKYMEKLKHSARWLPFDQIEEHVDYALKDERNRVKANLKREKKKLIQKGKIEIAKRLRDKGKNVDDIIEVTGLTEAEIKKALR